MSRLSNRLARIEAARAAPADEAGSGILCFECPADMTDDDATAVMSREVADAPGLAVRIGDAPVLAYTIARSRLTHEQWVERMERAA